MLMEISTDHACFLLRAVANGHPLHREIQQGQGEDPKAIEARAVAVCVLQSTQSEIRAAQAEHRYDRRQGARALLYSGSRPEELTR